ncbi:hypothetical protein JXA56_04625 [Candidatus Micrarchaeota archaeon]|nr:hypothetical protein [Candidatus Micrarchaeota archaeon]
MESEGEPFSVVIGRMETALKNLGQCQLSGRTDISIIHGKENVQRLARFVHNNLKKELLECSSEDQKRKRELISNIEAFCLGNGIHEFGIPAPEHALSFSESAERISRIAGFFVFRSESEGSSFEYIPLGRGSMSFLEDTDGASCLNIRKSAMIKVSSDKRFYFDGEALDFLAFIDVPPTLEGLHILQRKPSWRNNCPEKVQDEIDLLAMANNIHLHPRQSRPPVAAEEITKVERISNRPGIKSSYPTKIDIVWEEK